MHELVKLRLERRRDRTRFPSADRSKINFTQSNHLGCRSANKHLICDIQLVARNGFFNNGVAQIRSQGDKGVACDAFQPAAWWRFARREPERDFRPYTRPHTRLDLA